MVRNIQDLDPTTIRGLHNVSYVQVNGSHEINPDLRATFDTALGLRAFGPQILGTIGLENSTQGRKFQTGYQGALKKDAFTIAPGMRREAFAELDQRLSNGMDLSVRVTEPLQGDSRKPLIQAGFSGTLGTGKAKKKKAQQAVPTEP